MPTNTSLMYLAVPEGMPVPGQTTKRQTVDFEPDTVALNGGVLLKALAFDWSPYMRGRMREESVKSYSPPMPLNSPVGTLGVAKVLRSESDNFKVGDIVRGGMQMSEFIVLPSAYLAGLKVIDLQGLEATKFLGAVGMPGSTSWWSYNNIGKPKKGEAIFVSGAAGAVGQIVCQLAKIDGLKVIASAGSDEKVAYLKNELRADVAFNYKTESTKDIMEANEFDIYFDNVGGETLDLALQYIRTAGRIIACGAISQYNLKADERYGLKNSMNVVTKQLTYQGFIMTPDKDLTEFHKTMPGLVKSGKIKTREAVYKGLDDGEAFVDLLSGKAEGKVVVDMQ